MVLAALFPGMIAGFAAAVLGYAAAGLPLWMSVLLYPAVGAAVVVLAACMLALRCRMRGQPRFSAACGSPL